MRYNPRGIALAALCVVLAALAGGFLLAQRNAIVASVQTQERLTQEAQRNAMVLEEAGEAIRDALRESVQGSSAAGIVCWGDGRMDGNVYGSLPEELDDIVSQQLFQEIINDLFERTGVVNARGLAVKIANMGVSNEGFDEILARSGARQMTLGEALEVPAGTTAMVNLELADPEGKGLRFAKQRHAKFDATSIGGIDGKLYKGRGDYDRLHMRFAFRRDRKGEAVTIPRGTPVYTEGATKYRAYTPVLLFTEYEDMPVETFITGIEDMLALYGDGAFVLFCMTNADSAWDTALAERFGDRYIRVNRRSTNLRVADYQALAQQAFDALEAQGAFDAIHQAIDTAREQLDALVVE